MLYYCRISQVHGGKMKRADIKIFLTDNGNKAKAYALAQETGAHIVTDEMPHEGLFLKFDADGVSLCGGGLCVRGDFAESCARIKRKNLRNELLVKAVKIKNVDRPLTVVDATAGLGEDSFLLAAYGHSLTLFEYDPFIYALLEDSLERARLSREVGLSASRITAVGCDSVTALRALDFAPDVVLLDPMFPQRQKSSLVKKKFQLLHSLESPCTNEEELLDAARAAGPKKIVIKRPAKGAFLAGIKPDYSLDGKKIRYDCICLK